MASAAVMTSCRFRKPTLTRPCLACLGTAAAAAAGSGALKSNRKLSNSESSETITAQPAARIEPGSVSRTARTPARKSEATMESGNEAETCSAFALSASTVNASSSVCGSRCISSRRSPRSARIRPSADKPCAITRGCSGWTGAAAGSLCATALSAAGAGSSASGRRTAASAGGAAAPAAGSGASRGGLAPS